MAKTFKTAFISLVLFSASITAAEAATLGFSPSSGSYTVGGTFSVVVRASSTDQPMNAASGVVIFPKDKLEVTSLSKGSSIISLWVQEPSFSNSTGVINFEGIVLDPGFTGASGNLITVNFRAKSAGTAPLSFSSGSILANDGAGTSILKSRGEASFVLKEAPPPAAGPATAPVVTTPPGTPASAFPEAPTITHYSSQLEVGDALVIEGTSDPDSWVVLWLQKEGAEVSRKAAVIMSDQYGNFIFIRKQLEEGIYKFWAEALDQKNSRSLPTAELTAKIEQPTVSATCPCAADYLLIILALIGLIILLLAIIWYGWHRLFLLEVSLRRETQAKRDSQNVS